MAKRKLKKVRRLYKPVDLAGKLRKALSKQTKEALIDIVVALAKDDLGILKRLAAKFKLEASPTELVAATRHAISVATDFDERDCNSDFDYDSNAYDEVKKNLGRLIERGELRQAMELSIGLMELGSYQVESSDEGLMSDEIEECIEVVIKALKKCDLPPSDVVAWCAAMIKNDRLGFICDEELEALKQKSATSLKK